MTVAAHRFSNELRYREQDHPAQTQLTPGYVLEPVRAALDGIGLDPCTTPENPCGASQFYTVVDEGLKSAWRGPEWLPSVYVNPPYGKAREPWVGRCMAAAMHGQRVILLMPAATDTFYFQEAVGSAAWVVFIQGRVKFGIPRDNGRQVAASHPSALIGWNVPVDAVAHLGLCLSRPEGDGDG